jgi:hypothetical protein
MTAPKRQITRADLLSVEDYAAARDQHRTRVRELKKNRRIEVGPFATFYFESYDTMWLQVQEMLYIEKGGEAQVADELAAYNPLVPKGRELVATLMFEIADPDRRDRVLARLGGVELSAGLSFAGETVLATPEDDVERSTTEGRASSVHFLHFPFDDAQAAKFRLPATRVVLGLEHENYAHMAVLPEATRQALCADLD